MVTLPEEYLALKAERQRGFQTLYTYSELTHVDMETGFSLSVCLKDAANGQYLKHALIGRKEEGAEIVTPEAHDFKCRYTSVKVEFQNVKFRVESCPGKGVPLLLLVTPLSQEKMPPLIVLEGGYLWNRPGVVAREKNALLGAFDKRDGRTVLLAVLGGAFAEGVDLAGERLQNVIVVSTGLPQMDARVRAMRRYHDENGADGAFLCMTLPGMVRVIQSAGRLIRTQSDHGALLLIDSRYQRRAERELLSGTLIGEALSG